MFQTCVPDHSGQDLIVLVNLLHLISEGEARTLIREAATALAPGGRFLVYGPFMRAGELISEGDRAFHASLTAHGFFAYMGFTSEGQEQAERDGIPLTRHAMRKSLV